MPLYDPHSLYDLSNPLQMRWANPENYNAGLGSGGKAGFGRKGSPCRGAIQPGETWVLAEDEGSGTVRRIWITLMQRTPEFLRGIVLRMYWDGETKPAVETPLGDFFASPLGRMPAFESAWFDNTEGRCFNTRLPMPFKKGFRITVTNDAPSANGMFWYHVDYTLGDRHGPDTGYLHAYFNREPRTTLRKDFEVLPLVEGRGRYLGATMGVVADTKRYGKTWWGEGEVKIFLDGDAEFPTLCGTGTEDYICTAWGQGKYAMQWYGCPLADHQNFHFGFYRFHGPDPIHFQRRARITIQQIGWGYTRELVKYMQQNGEAEVVLIGDGSRKLLATDTPGETDGVLFEREDDWSATAYFYLDRPSNELPGIVPFATRVAGLISDEDAMKRADV